MNGRDIEFLISLFIFTAAVVWWAINMIRKYARHKRDITFPPLGIITVGIALSAFFAFLPSYTVEHGWLVSIFRSIQHTVRLFVVDDGYDVLTKFTDTATFKLMSMSSYIFIINLLFIIAPLTTFTAILTIFRKLWYHIKTYLCSLLGWEIHAFSELNERSLALAKSVIENAKKAKEEKSSKDSKTDKPQKARRPLIVFSDIIDKNEEAHLDLVEKAKGIGAILFRKDLIAVKWRLGGKKKVNFYLISDDENEKLRHAKYITENYNDENCKLYLFSDSIESELFMKSFVDKKEELEKLKIKGIRINEPRFLVYNYLWDNGVNLFSEFVSEKIEDKELKTIHITVVGYGKHGKEFVKALLWYCQIPGYKVNITVIDSDANAESKFNADFWPEIVTGKDFCEVGDMRYRIDFKTATFGKMDFIKEITNGTLDRHFFVCLGDDRLNFEASCVIKRELLRLSKTAKITTIVRNDEIKGLLTSVETIGNYNDYYSIKKFSMDSDMIKSGFDEHQRWDDKAPEKTFNFNDYNFYSSISKALHRPPRCKVYDIGIAPEYKNFIIKTSSLDGAEKYYKELKKIEKYKEKLKDYNKKDKDELRAIAEIEHVRWNAYMRTEGWCLAKATKKDEIAKTHPHLVPVDELPISKIPYDI